MDYIKQIGMIALKDSLESNYIERIRAFFRRGDLDRDFDQELESHLAMLAEDYISCSRRSLYALGATVR